MQKDVSPSASIARDIFVLRIWRQGRNYSTIVAWLLYTGFKGRTSKLSAAIVLSLLHLSAQGVAIYAIYWYGKQMERGAPAISVPYLDIQLSLAGQPEMLWAIVAFSTLCFMISAVFLYLSRGHILDIVEQHYARSTEQVVIQCLRLPDARARLASRLLVNYGVGGLITGCRRGALTAISFANAIIGFIGGMGAAVFLFSMELTLTLLILIAVGLAAFFLYPLTLRAMRAAKAREVSQLAFNDEIRGLAEQSGKGLKTIDDMARTYMMRRRVLTELVFAIEIGITMLLGIVIYYMANEALAGRAQWALFIAYIASLRMMLVGVAQAIQAFASVSRSYPQIVRYYLLLTDIQRINELGFATVTQGDVLILGALRNGPDVTAKVGDVIALLTFDSEREVQFALIEARLADSKLPIATAAVDLNSIAIGPPGLLVVASPNTDEGRKQLKSMLDRNLRDNLTLIAYKHAKGIGGFGERHLLTLMGGEFKRFAPLGSDEARAAAKEFAAGGKRSRRSNLFDPDDEDY